MTIQEWLNSDDKSYGIGLTLLAQHCKNRHLIQQLHHRQKWGKLEYELKKIAARLPNEPAAKEPETPTPPPTDDNVDEKDPIQQIISRKAKYIAYEQLPEELKVRWKEASEMQGLVRGLHANLKTMTESSDEEREPIATEIAELSDKIQNHYDTIDSYKPDDKTEQKPIAKDDKKLQKDIANARSYISKNLAVLEAGTLDDVKHAKRIDEVTKRVEFLRANKEEFEAESIQRLNAVGIK